MQNGYFRLVSDPNGYGVAIYQPREGGEDIQIGELIGYLDSLGIGYDKKKIEMLLMEERDTVCHLGSGSCPDCPESYQLSVTEQGMTAYVRFIPPAGEGKRLTLEDFMKDVSLRKITYGLKMESIQSHFSGPGIYCTDLLLAKGQSPVQGEDAKIEYFFNTDLHRRPKQLQDGSVDFFQMTTINQCRQGDLLAQIIPQKPGIPGYNIYNNEIKPREVRKTYLKYGRNINISEDMMSITSAVDGHVSLIDGTVFVADVYMVKGVDVSTGNLDYEGSIQVDGNVSENFEVKAGGNVLVNGLVEGARIVAGGSIIISKGMNGMQKGLLKAGGDIVVKYLENTKVMAGGYVEAEAIMHSRVSAGDEIRVVGRRGVIVGGYVQAGVRVTAKTIGADMGSSTILEVGINPLLKTQYNRMQEALADNTKTLDSAEVILNNFKRKMSQGFKYNESQMKYMRSVEKLVMEKNAELEQLNQRIERFRAMMEVQEHAEVVVNQDVYPGTTIIIGDASRTIQSSCHLCRFIRDQGEVVMKTM